MRQGSGQLHLKNPINKKENGKKVRKEVEQAGDHEMEENDLRDLECLCAPVEDPRMERTTRHRVRDSIVVAICGVICGAERWADIEVRGKAKEAFCVDVLDGPMGDPPMTHVDTCVR